MNTRYFRVTLFSLLVISALPAQAQVLGQNFNIFLGYSNLQGEGFLNRNNPPGIFDTDFFRDRTTLHGGNAEVTGAYKGVGLTGDVSFNRKRVSNDFSGGRNTMDTDLLYFMAGPSFHYAGHGHLEPFARILAGGARASFDVSNRTDVSSGSVTTSFTTKSTSFAMGGGGGLDLRLGDGPYKIRLIQVDYTPIFLRDKTIQVLGAAGAIQAQNLEGQRADNIRFSFGFVF